MFWKTWRGEPAFRPFVGNRFRVPPTLLPCLTAELVAGGLRVRMRVTGNSMAPLIRSGDVVVIGGVETRDLKPGDLILFTNRRGGAVLHRILRIDGNRSGGCPVFRTKGDAQGMMDEPVPAEAVLGQVLRIQRSRSRLAGRAIDLRSPLWLRAAPLLARVHLALNRFWSVMMRIRCRADTLGG